MGTTDRVQFDVHLLLFVTRPLAVRVNRGDDEHGIFAVISDIGVHDDRHSAVEPFGGHEPKVWHFHVCHDIAIGTIWVIVPFLQE